MQAEDRFLAAMGLKGLKGEAKKQALESILYTLNIKVGQRLAADLTDEQVDEFERLSRPGADLEKLAYWLSLNVPNHKQILEEETRKFRDETLDFVDEVMAKNPAPAADDPAKGNN